MPDYRRYKREENKASVGRRGGGALGAGKSVKGHREPTSGEKIRAQAGLKPKGGKPIRFKRPGTGRGGKAGHQKRVGYFTRLMLSILNTSVPGTATKENKSDTIVDAIRKVIPIAKNKGVSIKGAANIVYGDAQVAMFVYNYIQSYVNLMMAKQSVFSTEVAGDSIRKRKKFLTKEEGGGGESSAESGSGHEEGPGARGAKIDQPTGRTIPKDAIIKEGIYKGRYYISEDTHEPVYVGGGQHEFHHDENVGAEAAQHESRVHQLQEIHEKAKDPSHAFSKHEPRVRSHLVKALSNALAHAVKHLRGESGMIHATAVRALTKALSDTIGWEVSVGKSTQTELPKLSDETQTRKNRKRVRWGHEHDFGEYGIGQTKKEFDKNIEEAVEKERENPSDDPFVWRKLEDSMYEKNSKLPKPSKSEPDDDTIIYIDYSEPHNILALTKGESRAASGILSSGVAEPLEPKDYIFSASVGDTDVIVGHKITSKKNIETGDDDFIKTSSRTNDAFISYRGASNSLGAGKLWAVAVKETGNQRIPTSYGIEIKKFGDSDSWKVTPEERYEINEMATAARRHARGRGSYIKSDDSILLYRGIRGLVAKNIHDVLKDPSEGGVSMEHSAMESWTADENVARKFAYGVQGVVLTKRVPVENILFRGTGFEDEYVVKHSADDGDYDRSNIILTGYMAGQGVKK